ncbi:MAG TPA: serine/threonine-protein kinase [Kofleriaceae bacterium]|nr:serine/threonine-protein kinase [Kofleriaceae bacterium]
MYGPGSVVAGKYRIEHVLGQGGMGYVVAATHLDLGTPIALKFLHEHMLENRELVDRFKREARASAQLRGENVCRVSDVGTAENGQPFIVMELLQGQDLNSVVKERGALTPQVTAEIMLQTCLALAEAHMVGIVHRDVKPGNLMLTTRPDGTMCIKVLDFGVAKAPEDTNFSLTQTSSVVGSPGYMSPEQLKSSKGATVRSDIWSLGIVMYELVSGVKPWQGESITELALKVAMDPCPPLAGRVPWEFEAVVMHCLEKDPAKRYQDVADLAVALATFAGPRGPEMARAVARVLRGAHTPVPVTPASSLQTHAMPVPSPVPVSTPTTLRHATGAVAQSASQVTARKKKGAWKVPLIMGGGAAVGIAIALVIVSGNKKQATPAKQETETHEMASAPPTPATTPSGDDEQAKKEAAGWAAESAQQEDVAKKEADLAKKEAAKAEAAKLADEKKEADLAKKEAAKAEAAKLAAEKKEADLAKREAAKAEAAKVAAAKAEAKAEAAKAAAAKAEAKKAAAAKAAAAKVAAAKAAAAKAAAAKTSSTTKTTTTKTTKSKDIGDSRE